MRTSAVQGHVGPLDEAQAEQPTGAIERRTHTFVDRQVGHHLGVVEVITLPAHHLGVAAPVPRLDVAADGIAVSAGQPAQLLVLGQGRGAGRHQASCSSSATASGRLAIVSLSWIVGVGGLTVQPGQLTEFEDAADHRKVLGVAAAPATHATPPPDGPDGWRT